MRNGSTAAIAFMALAVLIVMGYNHDTSAQQLSAAKLQHWKYKAVDGLVDVDQFNDLGGEGWELVTVHPLGGSLQAVFKKPIN